MTLSTCDLCDQFPDRVRVLAPIFRHYGGRTRFAGPIVTIRCFEDNVFIREAAVEEGRGRVMVIDGGGSLRSALVGDGIAEWARDHGWAGMIIYGCVRDTVALAEGRYRCHGDRRQSGHPRETPRGGARRAGHVR